MASTTDETPNPAAETTPPPDQAGSKSAPPPETRSNGGNGLSSYFSRVTRLPNWLNFWIPLTASLISLVLAIISLIASTQDPELLLILPNQIYLSEAGQGGDEYRLGVVYLQPNFVSTGNNDRWELVKGMTLKIEPADGSGQPLNLVWREQGSWNVTEGFQVMIRTYVYSADAAPMFVSPSQAQQPLTVFPVETDWLLQPGVTYRLTLTAERAVASGPLVAAAEMNVPAELIDAMKAQTQQTIMTVPVTPIVGQ